MDVIPEKVEKINKRISPIQDDYIENYLAEKELFDNLYPSRIIIDKHAPEMRKTD